MPERASWRALGTSAHVLVEGGDLATARAAVAGLLDDVDRTYSRFRPDSELSRLNAGAGSMDGAELALDPGHRERAARRAPHRRPRRPDRGPGDAPDRLRRRLRPRRPRGWAAGAAA